MEFADYCVPLKWVRLSKSIYLPNEVYILPTEEQRQGEDEYGANGGIDRCH